jgi:cell division protease FtsH
LLKVTIIPRGKSLGAAWYLPEEHYVHTRSQFFDHMCVALGGRAAEDIFFDEVSSNALDDLEKSTKQAYNMVVNYGLSEGLGNVSYYDSTGTYENAIQKPFSERTAQIIDTEVKALIDSAFDRTRQILVDHKEAMQEIAELLLEKEVIYQDDLKRILGEKVRPATA